LLIWLTHSSTYTFPHLKHREHLQLIDITPAIQKIDTAQIGLFL
jgi:hypothetical protein